MCSILYLCFLYILTFNYPDVVLADDTIFDENDKVYDPPRSLEISGNVTDTSIKITWQEPINGKYVTKYIVRTEVLQTYAKSILPAPSTMYQNYTRHAELVNLHPGTKYQIYLAAASDLYESENVSIIAETTIGIPDSPNEPIILSKEDKTMMIKIEQAINNNGPINFYRVIVHFIDGILQTFDEDLVTDYQQSQEDGLPYYIAAELGYQNRSIVFTVGDGKMYQGYYNPPLPSKTHVHISIGIVSKLNGFTKIRYAKTTHEQHSHIIVDKEIEDKNSTLIVILSIACVIFGILLLASIIAYFYIRVKVANRLRRLSDNHEMSMHGPIIEIENGGFIADSINNQRESFQDNLVKLFEKLTSQQKLVRNSLTLDIDHIIGTGRFGDVIRGNLYKTPDSYSCQVHVISDDMEKDDEQQFLIDCNNLITLINHKNLQKFYGVCMTADWIYIVVEDIPINLKKKLHETNDIKTTTQTTERLTIFTEEFILRIMLEIADCMEYLSSKKFVHKQLCSYNVKITQQNEIKLTIFGPTLFNEQNNIIDLSRWLAPEVLKFQNHTIKSDVWSFGCLMWECITLGATLYPNIPTSDLLPRIKNGARPEQPSFVYDDLYQLLLYCWELDFNERPTFKEIKDNLQQLMTAPKHALSFDKCDGVALPYFLPLLEVKN